MASRAPGRKQSDNYRYQLTHDLLVNLNRGECCAVVGVGSCGKSRLLKHLSHPDTMHYHLGSSAYDHFIILVECNSWLDGTNWAAYEGIARSLFELVERTTHPLIRASKDDLQNMYIKVTSQRDLAFVHLKSAISNLIQDTQLKITLCFDEFDFVFEQFDAQLFRTLRALRNQNKYRLTYLAATRRQLPYQRPETSWPDVEEFYELFADNTYAIGPYGYEDAVEMIDEMAGRLNFPLQPATRDLLYQFTGGHPGMLGAAFRLLEASRQQPASQDEMARLVAHDPTTWKECQRIWESLRPVEHEALRKLATASRPVRTESAGFPELRAKGLITTVDNHGTIMMFSPILHEFVRLSGV